MNDDFEKRLQQVTPREIPSAWREEILAADRAHSSRRREAQTSVPASRPGLIADFIYRLSRLSRPHRAAWAALATSWVIILALHVATKASQSPTVAQGKPQPLTPETLQVLKQQRLLYAELAAPVTPAPPHPVTPALPGPRSQRREDTFTV
jgi:hypothetical protein